MKAEMIQNPLAIQEVPGFMPARMARVGEPRSARRQTLPMASAGNPIHNPMVVEASAPSPMSQFTAPMV
jgi:hypothetical protein